MRIIYPLILCILLVSTHPFACTTDHKAAPKPNQQLINTILKSSKTASFLIICTATAIAGCYLMAKNSSGPLNKINSAAGGAALVVLGLAGTMFHEQFNELCQQAMNRITQRPTPASTVLPAPNE